MNTWECSICGFVYEEEKGMPEHWVPPGTRSQDVPEDWTCPDCGVSKRNFDMRQATPAVCA